VVLTPVGQFKNKGDFNYQQVRVNVNCLKLIQVGFTLANERGELPTGHPVWQFNFHFNLLEDSISYDSSELLKGAGIDFNKHQTEGIAIADFGELLTTSGLLVDKHVTWITFHRYVALVFKKFENFIKRCVFQKIGILVRPPQKHLNQHDNN